jgi:hypothetical protein
VKSRVLRAVPWITFGFVAVGLIAYALGRVTRTEWVWWLAPLTVAVDGSILLRPHVGHSAALSPLEDHLVADLDVRMLLTSSAAAAIMAAYGAFTGNRSAIITGAVLAIVGNALEHADRTGSITSGCVPPTRALAQRSTVNHAAVVEPRP